MKRHFLIFPIIFAMVLPVFLLILTSDSGKAQIAETGVEKSANETSPCTKDIQAKAFAEAATIKLKIKEILLKKKSKFEIEDDFAYHLQAATVSPISPCMTNDKIVWVHSQKSRLTLRLLLGLKADHAKDEMWRALDSISMGDFFALNDIGDEAIVVKNVNFNRSTTNVSVHFRKGRARISLFIANSKQSTDKNEKELTELIRLIEPVVLARANFDD